MIEQGFLKKHYVGRDGFVWWIGQITDSREWKSNLAEYRVTTLDENPGFDYRYKVRIMGYHTSSEDLKDSELPWASVMLPVTAGGGTGGSSQTPNLRQGNFVYGFFADGEDGQQPIIMGVLGYNQYTPIVNGTLKGNSPFKPFEGYTNRETVATYSLRTTNTDQTPAASPGNSTNLNKTKIQDSTGYNNLSDGASAQQKLEGTKESTVALTSVCEKQPLGGIQLEIKNLIMNLENAKNSINDWKTRVSTNIADAQKFIDEKVQLASKKIAEGVQWVIREIEKRTIDRLENALKVGYSNLFPNTRASVKEGIAGVLDAAACVFRKILKNLYSIVSKLLVGVVDKVVNVPRCFAEEFLSTILGGIVGEISSGIKSILSTVTGLVGTVADLAGDIIGFIQDIFSFLSCDEQPECPTVDTWSPWDGPSKSESINLGRLISGIKSKVKGGVDSVTNVVDSVSAIPGNIANSVNGFIQNPLGGNCDVGPLLCGPPTVQFFGGGGSGASGNVIVDFAGSIIGVDLTSTGGGYSRPPFVSFQDTCGTGTGAVGRAILRFRPDTKEKSNQTDEIGGEDGNDGELNFSGSSGSPGATADPATSGITTTGGPINTDGFQNGEVIAVVIEDPGYGYLYQPDGSQGGGGRTFANYCETIVRRANGTYDVPYVSGKIISLKVGDWVQFPNQAAFKITEDQEVTAPTCEDLQSPGQSNPTDTTTSYPVDLVIGDFEIINPGYDYQEGDTVVNDNDDTFSAVVTSVTSTGAIRSVELLDAGRPSIEYTKLFVNSDAGFNAVILPKYDITRLTPEEVEIKLTQGQEVLSVIDCVGKV